jgi:hypothetical protein
MRVENEKVVKNLIDKFRADNENVRQEISLEVQTEIKNKSKEIDLVRKENERELDKVKENIKAVSADMDERLRAYVRNSKKELEICENEAIHRSKTLVKEMNEQKKIIEAVVKDIEQNVAQTKDDVESRVERVASDVKEISNAILADKQVNVTEIQKLKTVINQIQAKICSSDTPHHSPLIRNECMSQDSCKSPGLPPSQSEQTNSTGVNGISACSTTACDESMINVRDSVCAENVSAVSVVAPNGHNLEEFSLPKFKNSSKQLVIHFLRELDEYFVVKKIPAELKLPLCFKAIEDPFAKQWFTTVYETIGTYVNVKSAFTNLLWGQTRQAQIRCSIYQDRWDKGMNESYTEHYIRYASQVAMLNPPLSEEDLAGAMVGHFPPEIQNGLICANLKTTQDAIAYLGNMQTLEITGGEHIRRPCPEYNERNAYSRPTRGRINDSEICESRHFPQTRNV